MNKTFNILIEIFNVFFSCHVFFKQRLCGGVKLDRDRRRKTEKGPETITIKVRKTILKKLNDTFNKYILFK